MPVDRATLLVVRANVGIRCIRGFMLALALTQIGCPRRAEPTSTASDDARPPAPTWQIRCPERDPRSPADGERVEIPPGCAAKLVTTLARDHGSSFAVDLRNAGAEVFLVRVRADGLELEPTPFGASRHADRWRFTSPVIEDGHAQSARVVVFNKTAETNEVIALHVDRDHPVPAHPVGSILSAEHYSEVAVRPGKARASIWLPLPAMHGAQVPLDVQLRLEPPDAGTVELVGEPDVNFGVLVHFAPAFAHPRVVIAWTATLLTRDVTPERRPQMYPERPGDEAWLGATVSADADDPRAQAIARELVAAAGADPAARLAALFGWLGELPPMPGPDVPDPHPGNQSSQLLFAPARANCTGSTNVTSALARVLGIPTRHVAGILTGEALQTHAVNELLLGNPRSWVRVEPQLGAVVQHDYMVVLRIASPLDEGPASVDPERFAAPGVPMYTLIEGLGERTRLTLDDLPEHFEGCPRCDNAAQRLGVLEDTSLERLQQLHARAAELWQRDRARWIATPRAGLPDARRQASAIARLDDLETLLQRLE